MDDENEDGAFDAAAVKAIATKMCNNILLNQPFVHAKVPIWSSTIIENVLKELAVINDEAAKKNLQKFKYIGEPPLLAAASDTSVDSGRDGRRQAPASEGCSHISSRISMHLPC